VSAGVNFPARTIVFFNSDKFNGKQFLPLTPTEFHQMTGRAGRRGMDKIGFALIVPDKFMDVKLIQRLLSSRATDITSQIKINFSMVLNLLLSHNPEQIEVLLKRSFANYLSTKSKHKKNASASHKDIWRDFLRHLNFLKATGFVTDEDRLTQDGRWASQLRVDQPLLIAEGFRQGLFPQSNAEILAAITATFVYEREIDDRVPKKFLPNQLARAFHKVTRGLKPFASKLVQHKFEVRPQLMRPAATIYAWAMGNSWENVLGLAEMEEGDLAMLILRTADNLRHIRNLKDVFPDTATDAAKAIEKILREPVPFY
jgi:superfamily II RNA helicase